jgi:hypothetical protein
MPADDDDQIYSIELTFLKRMSQTQRAEFLTVDVISPIMPHLSEGELTVLTDDPHNV